MAERQMATLADFAGTDRLEVRRRIGSGSFGTVYEGWDRERRALVAIKWLRFVDVDTIQRFKNEFRSLAEISHPNLVQLYDFENDGDDWFFTMELVRGVPLPEHLRPDQLPRVPSTVRTLRTTKEPLGPDDLSRAPVPYAQRTDTVAPPLDVEPTEIRAVFAQLAQGIVALHQAGRLHCDLKCQNVLITPAGRAVILDFGLVRPVDLEHDAEIAGTPLYMAPEQCAGATQGKPTDWYAFGVMLFRALTNSYPFDGRMFQVIGAKQTRDAPRVSQRVAGAPDDLVELCRRLLARRAEDRPSEREILEVLGASAPSRPSFPPLPTDQFIGRRRELRTLEAARRAVRSGGPVAVYITAASGIGKTALVRCLLDRVRETEPDTWILEGRCYERETLPYKALDAVVDSLAAHLVRLSQPERAAIAPEHIADLVRVFPVLDRAFPTSSTAVAPDPQEQRRRAVAAFVDLFRRLSRKREIVVFMDDLQWGDRDSATLVAPLLDDAEAPILWLGTYRSGEARTSPFLEALGRRDALVIELPELDEEEARTLLELRLAGTARSEDLLESLAREVAGSPLLIDLLARHAKVDRRGSLDLAAVVAEALRELPEQARRLLPVLAVHGQPLTTKLAAEILGVEALDIAALTQVRNARLVRVRELDEGETLDVYHDRIREIVVADLTRDEERELHATLAAALRASDADPELLAAHYLGAGDRENAFRFTVDAARRAEQALAFDRAAELYRAAIELEDDVELSIALGDAYKNAGRGADAARAYLAAADRSERKRALELRRQAAEQYLFSGHIDQGHAVLRTVLEAVGLAYPEHPVRVLAEFLARRTQVRIRGLRFRERPLSAVSEDDLLRIDTCWSVSCGLAMIDPVRGGIFQARHLLMALEAGELTRVARAVAVEVPFSATSGIEASARTEELARIGRALAERTGVPRIIGLITSSTGGAAWLEGRWTAAFDLEEKSIGILRRECTGVAWEISTSLIVLLDALWRTGRFPELLARLPEILADAASRGDLFLEVYLRIKFGSLAQLIADRPEEARRESRDALARWSQAHFSLMNYWDLFAQTEALLYEGRAREAHERIQSTWSGVKQSQLLQLQMYDVTARDLAGRAALALAAATAGKKRFPLLSEVTSAARRLERTGAPWALGLAAMLEAGAAYLRGERNEAVGLLARAEVRFREHDMVLHANVAHARRAQLTRSKDDYEETLETLRKTSGLAEPEKWIALLAPGGPR